MVDLAELVDVEVTMAYAKYAVLAILKMMLMSSATAFFRFKNKVSLNK